MTTKRFPRHGVTVQNGRELIALSASAHLTGLCAIRPSACSDRAEGPTARSTGLQPFSLQAPLDLWVSASFSAARPISGEISDD